MRTLGSAKYYKYSECNEGDVLVEKGRYRESTDGKFGVVHYFEELDTRESIGLNSAGALNNKMDKLTEGDVVKIIYQGQSEIQSGSFEGKMAHQFKVMVYDESDLEDAPKATAPAKKMVAKAAPENKAAPKKATATKKKDLLDELE